MLCEELLLCVSTLLKGLIRRHAQKNITTKAKINIVFQSKIHTETTEQNTLHLDKSFSIFGQNFCTFAKVRQVFRANLHFYKPV